MSSDEENSKGTEDKVQDVANTAQDVANATQDVVKGVENFYTGKYLQLANNVVNLLKNKTARRHLIISWSISIIAPMLILLLIAGLFMVVVSSIGEIVTDIVSTMGELFSGVGNWFTSLFDPDTGKYIITISEEKFDEIKSSLASQGIDAEASNLTDECLKLFMLAQYKTQYPEDVRIKIEISEEEKNKIPNRVGNNIDEKDGKYYLVTDGCIKLYRADFDDSNSKYTLKYIELDDLEQKIQEVKDGAKSFEYIKDLYTIDNGNLRVATKTTIETYKGVDQVQETGSLLDLEYEEDNEVWENFRNDKKNTSRNVKEIPDLSKPIPYQSMISSYTMPFEFMTILTTFTQNSEYGVAVAQLVMSEKTSIELNVLDESEIVDEREIEQYNSNTNASFKVGAKANLPIYSALWNGYTGNIKDYYLYEDGEWFWRRENKTIFSPERIYEYNPIPTPRIRRKNIITTEYTPTIKLGKVQTWYVSKENTYNLVKGESKLDGSKIEDVPAEDPFIFNINNESAYGGLDNVYNNDVTFRNFIENYYIKDTGKKGYDDFRDDLINIYEQTEKELQGKNVDVNYKDDLLTHINMFVQYQLFYKFYRFEIASDLNVGTLDYNTVMDRIYEVLLTTNQTITKQYNHTVDAKDDYFADSTNDKIKAYDVMPIKITNKKTEHQIKKSNYKSNNKYNVTQGTATDNTDAFIKLLKDKGKYVEYKTTKPGADLASAPDMLFEILASNSKTANLENAMRYIMYKMTNRDYGIQDFGFSLYSMESFSSIGNMIQGTIQDKVWYALKKLGYSDYSIAGVMGNIHWESGGFNPAIVEGDTGVGFGLCQWSYGRRTQLENFAASRGKEPSDEDIQIEFLLGEINPSGGADGYAGYQLVTYNGYSGDDWRNATSVEEATKAFCWSFERPGVPHIEERIIYAESYYNQYRGKNWAAYEKSKSTFGTSGKATAIIAAAESKIGCPYVYGANGPNQFDCSGLVCWSYEQAGINIWGYRTELGNMSPKDISMSEAQPGDVLWKKGHVALCVSNANGVLTYIEAPERGFTVRKVETTDYKCFTKACRWIP